MHVSPGDFVELAVDNGYFILPADRCAGIVLEVREIPVESWCDGETKVVPKKYADILIAGNVRHEVPCSWLGVIREAR